MGTKGPFCYDLRYFAVNGSLGDTRVPYIVSPVESAESPSMQESSEMLFSCLNFIKTVFPAGFPAVVSSNISNINGLQQIAVDHRVSVAA